MTYIEPKPHKFFERHLDNNLDDLSKYLLKQYERIEKGEIIKGKLFTDGMFSETNSDSTMHWRSYNAFQFYNQSINKLYKEVVSMAKEACEYHGINFEEQNYYTQSWFNINYSKTGKLDWHNHGKGTEGAPFFHGYYCVSAEPSNTHYRVRGKEIVNVNKNNRAVLAEMNYPHAMADWDWDGPRITIAYDLVPLKYIVKEWEQHWIPVS
jgi:hypothetical protein